MTTRFEIRLAIWAERIRFNWWRFSRRLSRGRGILVRLRIKPLLELIEVILGLLVLIIIRIIILEDVIAGHVLVNDFLAGNPGHNE